MKIRNLENENRKVIKSVDNFHVLEYVKDASVSPMNAAEEDRLSLISAKIILQLFRPEQCSGWGETYRQRLV